MLTYATLGPVSVPVEIFLTVAVPSPLSILKWVSVVHTSCVITADRMCVCIYIYLYIHTQIYAVVAFLENIK